MAKELTIISDAPGEKMFLLGNEAIARGAIEAGVQVAAAYPGTPSSEIVGSLGWVAKSVGMYVEWSVNEKVAFEVALAGSICGVRAMACMKHVGVNVCHDPLMTAGYIGAKGGLLLVVADDPWMWSSQNEQDTRYVAEQAYIPVLEPSTVQEAKDMTVDAFKLSEEFGQPFILRSVTRLSHSRGDVVLGELPKEKRKASWERNIPWLVYTPAGARRNRVLMIQRFEKIKEAVNQLPYNQLKLSQGSKIGIIASGLSYSYVLEALRWLQLEDKVSLLKIGTSYPLPAELVRKLLTSVEKVLVVEELEPFVENHTKIIAAEAGIVVKIHGKDLVPLIGELSTEKVVKAIADFVGVPSPIDFTKLDKFNQEVAPLLPKRPPILCPGCPHRASNYAIKVAARRVAREMGKDLIPIYPSDIGCYALAVEPPLETVDSIICMGGGFGLANGFAHIVDNPVVAHLGDSTFFHAGIPPLINAVWNKANITMVVLDNSATSMTGFQPHPGTGSTAMGEEAVQLKPEDVAKACGVKFVEVVDPYDLKQAIEVMEKAIKFDGPAFVVMRRMCTILAMRERERRRKKGEAMFAWTMIEGKGREEEPLRPYQVDPQKCSNKCNACIQLLGCPAISKENGKAVIDTTLCFPCGVCAQICPYKAIL